MDKDARHRQHKPFLFDVNNFDDAAPVDPDAPPPPPIYNDADLDAARAAAVEQGRLAGRAESDASRAAEVAGLTNAIAERLTTLMEAEVQRSRAYEFEILLVSRAIFARLFPGLNETNGLAEIERVIALVLEAHRQQPEIIVEVNSAFVADIRALADEVLAKTHNPGKVTVKPNDSLWQGDCRLLWNDGGADRNATSLAASIQRHLDETLAGKPLLQDNRPTDDASGV